MSSTASSSSREPTLPSQASARPAATEVRARFESRARSARPAESGESARPRGAIPGDWRALFDAADSREVLTRLMRDDPLGLRGRVAARLLQRAYLLDVDRALLRSFARTARAAHGYRGDPPLGAWLDERIDEALADLLIEDHEAARAGAPVDERQAAVFATLGRPLGLAALELRSACVAFNRLPAGDRAAFHALAIRGRTLDELARERDESASDTARAARRGLDALLGATSAPEQPSTGGRT
jgi:hypothetical protein